MLPLTIHKDGTVTYWSVYQQRWIVRADPRDVPDREQAAMLPEEREKIARAVERWALE